MEDKINHIRNWLGTGAINIFGKAFSGKDTVGQRLAKLLGAEFLGSGDIIRAARNERDARIAAAVQVSDQGGWMPTDEFRDLVLPYLADEKLRNSALILSMVGRWIGEEKPVIETLKNSGHDIHAVVVLNVSDEEIWRRWEIVGNSRNGGTRADDSDKEKITRRLADYGDKTLPVIDVYRNMDLVIEINGEQTREEVFAEVIDKIYEFSLKH